MMPATKAAVEAASQATGIPAQAIMSKRRFARWTLPRFIAWELLRRDGFPLAQIGTEFDRDHTSIINGMRRLKQKTQADEAARAAYWNARRIFDRTRKAQFSEVSQ